jgi:hypothetical protein
MSQSKEQLIRWLQTLDKGAEVWIDEGGLTLESDSPVNIENSGNAYLELGGKAEND